MARGLVGLLDDVAALTKLAAASNDDVGAAVAKETARRDNLSSFQLTSAMNRFGYGPTVSQALDAAAPGGWDFVPPLSDLHLAD